MNIQSFSIISGTSKCDADCPYCISKMTGFEGISNKPMIDLKNFKNACRLAEINKVTSVIITGKGEPLLFPKQVTRYLEQIKKFNFPLVELQTNGLSLGYQFNHLKPFLKKWQRLGLNIITISVVHYHPDKNAKIFSNRKEYINLPALVKRLHTLGFSVRFSCTLIKNFISNPLEVVKMANFARELQVEQLSLRPVISPRITKNRKIAAWVKENKLSEQEIGEIKDYLDEKGQRLVTYGHNSILYDLGGQNVCLTNALTLKPETDNIRQLIYFPDGHLRFDWQYKGAIIL